MLLYESEQPEKVPVAYLRTGSNWNHGLGRYSHLLPEEAFSFIVLRRMSGEALRHCCLNNDVEGLRKICRERGNPCSPDDLGLTGLMYAVFNGHLQCVKLVARNPMGVDLQGVRCSCVNLRSCKGYTALHLAMLDAPTWAARETIFVLLLSNADPLVRCTEGLTPYELALREGNALAMDAFDDFYLLSESPHPQRVPFEKRSEHSRIEVDIKVERLRLGKLQEELEKKFVLHPAEEVNWDVSVTKVTLTVAPRPLFETADYSLPLGYARISTAGVPVGATACRLPAGWYGGTRAPNTTAGR